MCWTSISAVFTFPSSPPVSFQLCLLIELDELVSEFLCCFPRPAEAIE